MYCDEEEFSTIDFEIENKIIRIFKLHGSTDNKDSIRATMKAVASKTLSDKRMNVIRYLFSSGEHKNVLILGYSCSDIFDITLQIQSIEKNRKGIFFVEHSKEGKEIEDVGKKEVKNLFKKFPGVRIRGNTDDFIKDLWNSNININEKYELIKFEIDWKTYLDDWAKGLKDGLKYFIGGTILYTISKFKRAIEYYEKSLEIKKAIGDEAGESKCYANLGIVYRNLGEFKKAIEYFLKSENILKKTEQIHLLKKVYKNLTHAYEKIGDDKNAKNYKRKLNSK